MNESVSKRFQGEMAKRMQVECEKFSDPSHDFLHVDRVVGLAHKLAVEEGANLDIVLPAAYLHDVVLIPKNDPRRSQASLLSANEAVSFLRRLGYPEIHLEAIHHAIHAHSFSAKVTAQTLEAKVVQDADRLDGLGAIGIARCFALGGVFGRTFYSETDAFCETRSPDDSSYTLDHFYSKLLKVPDLLETQAGRREGEKRRMYLLGFVQQLRREIFCNLVL